MSFAQFYHREERIPTAEKGNYDVEIVSVQEKFTPGKHFIECSFKYSDGVSRLPNTFRIYQPGEGATDKQISWFNILLTEFVDCFGLNPDFSYEGLKKMAGSKGNIGIEENNDGYMEVKNFNRIQGNKSTEPLPPNQPCLPADFNEIIY